MNITRIRLGFAIVLFCALAATNAHGLTGRVIGMQTFGASAPLKALMKEYGFTVENVVAAAEAQLALVAQS